MAENLSATNYSIGPVRSDTDVPVYTVASRFGDGAFYPPLYAAPAQPAISSPYHGQQLPEPVTPGPVHSSGAAPSLDQNWLADESLSCESCQSCCSCSNCGHYGCSDCSHFGCTDCPHHGLYIFEGYDAFQGRSDDGWENNGLHAGVNFGTRLGAFSDLTGIGFQIGGSAAAYDWAGTDYRLTRESQAEPQGFVTYGLFRKANEDSAWSAAVVQDWMINANFGVFAQNPTLSQVRAQVGYAFSDSTEFGLWGAWRVLEDTRAVPGFGEVTWRGVNQLSFYWHYKWGAGQPDTWLWIGLPERDRLAGNGSLGDYVVGALANAPLGDRISLYALVTYMHPSGAPGPNAAAEEAWDFTIGLAFYPQYNARTATVAGQCWMPQLPVANNGYFLVDTNRGF